MKVKLFIFVLVCALAIAQGEHFACSVLPHEKDFFLDRKSFSCTSEDLSVGCQQAAR